MSVSRDDFSIAFRSALLQRGGAQKFSILSLIILAIFILLILNLLQLRYLGFIQMNIKDVQDRLIQIEEILEQSKGVE